MNAEIGKLIIISGILLIGVGAFFVYFSGQNSIPKLPGDIYIKRDNFTFFFPIVSSIVISIVLTLIFALFSRK